MEKNIILFGHDGCGFCVKAKKWLDDNKIKYVNKDVTDEQIRKEFETYKADGIPLFIIKDNEKQTEEKIVGFTIEKMVAVLNK
ncbi:glutaredoxin family protein [Bacillus cereus]|nr:glutaredoxin family protein [Bacillus cereus]